MYTVFAGGLAGILNEVINTSGRFFEPRLYGGNAPSLLPPRVAGPSSSGEPTFGRTSEKSIEEKSSEEKKEGTSAFAWEK